MSNDLFEAQIEVAAASKALELLNDPQYLQGKLSELIKASQEKSEYIALIEPKAARHDAWLDSTGHFGCDTVAEKLRIPYITPGGKRSEMGEKKFCQALAYLGVIIKTSDGYRVSKPWYPYAKEVTKLAVDGRNHWSVKFNPEGVDKLADLFESMDGAWRSTGVGGVTIDE